MKLLTKTWIPRILLLVVTCMLAGMLVHTANAQGSTDGSGTGTSTSDTATEPSTSDTSTASGESEMAEGTGTSGTTTTETETDTVVGTTTTTDNGSGTNTGATDTGNQPLLWILGAALVIGIGALLLRRPRAETNTTHKDSTL